MSRRDPDREEMLQRIEEQTNRVRAEVEALLAQIRESRKGGPEDDSGST